MNVETTTQTLAAAPAMPLAETEERASRSSTLLYAPPFDSRWAEERSPNPNGFWSYCGLDRNPGLVHLQLGRHPEGVDSGLKIGYLGGGWRYNQRVFLGPTSVVRGTFTPDLLVIRPNGGTMVPWGFVTVRRRSDGRRFEFKGQLSLGTSTNVHAYAPTYGYYDVSASVTFRGSYSGAGASPYGEIRARINPLLAFNRYSSRDAIEEPEARLIGENGDDVAKLDEEAHKAAFDKALVREIGSTKEAVSAGLQEFEAE
ncbi:MAG: hypothetical protein GY719_32445 [bacterium]|nr:hypothetical protein [bacterium]